MRKLYPEALGPVTDVPNSGPAPVLLRADEWLLVRSMHSMAWNGMA